MSLIDLLDRYTRAEENLAVAHFEMKQATDALRPHLNQPIVRRHASGNRMFSKDEQGRIAIEPVEIVDAPPDEPEMEVRRDPM